MKTQHLKNIYPSSSAPRAPHWLSPENARAELAREIEQFLEIVVMGEAEGQTLVIRASAGIGKTIGLLRQLGASTPLLLAAGHIQVMLPTHDLANEAYAVFRDLFPDIPALVFRGRDATHPGTGKPMCEKAHLVARVSEICGSVSQSLCQTWCPFEKRMRRAECYDGCAWRAQIPQQNSVIFMSHAYLTSGSPMTNDVVLRVVDEKFYANLLSSNSISAANWIPKQQSPTIPESADAKLDRARGIVFEALRTCAPVNTCLREAGFRQQDMKRFQTMERQKVARLTIFPDQKTESQSAAINGFDIVGLRTARSCASVWATIDQSWDSETTQRLTLEEIRKDGETRHMIRIHKSTAINTNIPTIMLDADADPAIIETFRPGARFVSLDVAPTAEIVQVRDRTFSNMSLLKCRNATRLRQEVAHVIAREVDRAEGRGVLLVATKDVLCQFQMDADPSRMIGTDEELMAPLHGAEPRWYGPRLQGVNTYQDFETVILLGRLEPPAEVIDGQLRALTGDGDKPLVLSAGMDNKCGWFPRQQGFYLRRDQTLEHASIRHHPDPRGAALLAQAREAGMLQAMARIRAVGATAPKRILILCSIPLPNTPIDHLVYWDEFVTGVPAELKVKVAKLRDAIRRPDGTIASAIRLSVDGIFQDAPHVFRTRHAAAEWRRGLPSGRLCEVIDCVARLEGLAMSLVSVGNGVGRKTPTLIVSSHAPRDQPA